MKNIFFIIMMALLPILINSSYGQQRTKEDNKQKEMSQKNSDEEMFKYLNLSQEQVAKIQAIRKNSKESWKVMKDVPQVQNALLFNMATTQESFDNVLSPAQKVRMRKFEMKQNYTEGLKQKVNLSPNQEDKIANVSEMAYDKQQAIINNTSLSEEDIKQQIGKLNNETSNEVTNLLTAEQKKQLETEKGK